jgi:hypothetical protein
MSIYSRRLGRWIGLKLREAIKGEKTKPQSFRSATTSTLCERVEALESLTATLARCVADQNTTPFVLEQALASQRATPIVSKPADATHQNSTASTAESTIAPDCVAKKGTVH